jgi:hypothetical protein
MHKPEYKARANARISDPNYCWQRTALNAPLNRWIRDSKLLPFLNKLNNSIIRYKILRPVQQLK